MILESYYDVMIQIFQGPIDTIAKGTMAAHNQSLNNFSHAL